MFENNPIVKLQEKSIAIIELLLVLLLVMILLPFIVLSYFNAPAVDDFSFALKTMDFGFWGGQVEAYKNWNGRYFTSFILCTNIFLKNGFMLYKLLPIMLILGNIHSIYTLFNTVTDKSEKITNLIFSITVSLIFLNFMPSINQGIYWAPGAVTYNLGNIMVVYCFAYFIKSYNSNSNSTIKVITIIFTILGCGLNESSMVAIDLILVVFLLYHLLIARKVHSFLLAIFIIAVICTIIMASSPGNHIRDLGFLDPHKKNLIYTISSSFSALHNFLSLWLLTPKMIMLSGFSLLLFISLSNNNLTNFKNWTQFILVLILGYCIVAATLAPGFWSTGYIAPERTINAVLWLFLIWWFSVLHCLACILKKFFTTFTLNKHLLLAGIIIICLSFTTQQGNINKALNDVISGRGYQYGLEWKNRIKIIEKSKNTNLSILPEFSMIPGTIFHEDIKADEEEWFNKEFARYFSLSKVKLGAPVSTLNKSIVIKFENDTAVKFKNPVSLSSEFALSAPNSNILNGENTYSGTYETLINEIDPTGVNFKTVVFEANVLSPFKTVDYVLVVSINDANNKNILWQGKEVKNDTFKQNTWNKEIFTYTIKDGALLKPENKLAIYIWNRSKNVIYTDDFNITFR